jgi:hypothetical protein
MKSPVSRLAELPGAELSLSRTATGQGAVPPAPPATADDHLPAAGFAFSCFGFLFFLSFFWELLPLPMAYLLTEYVDRDSTPARSLATTGRFGQPGF